MAKSYRLIIFDMGKVLVDFDQDAIARRLMAFSKKSFPEILAYYRSTDIFNEFECGRLTPEEALANVNTMLGTRLSMPEFRTAWSDIFSDIPEMHEVVDMLGKKHKLALLSDTNVLHYEFIAERFPIVGKIKEHTLSFHVGARKPDSRMYQAVLSRAGVSAEESIFIDDKEKNVKGARSLGITAIHHHSPEETKKALKKLGVWA